MATSYGPLKTRRFLSKTSKVQKWYALNKPNLNEQLKKKYLETKDLLGGS